MLGGLCLFLFGMNVMGDALERRAGSKLQSLLGKLTSGKMMGLLTGLGGVRTGGCSRVPESVPVV